MIIAGIKFPKPPGIKAVHKFASVVVNAAGARNIHGFDGVMLDAARSMMVSIDEAQWHDVNGFAHLQVIGDSARAKKTFGVTNICFRGFHDRAFFNGYASMHHL